jgi:hypothetical protein
LLRWMLPSCAGGIGLKICRAHSEDGPYECITSQPLPDEALGSYVDTAVWPGGTFWYELRALRPSGSEDLVTDTRPSVSVPGALELGIRSVAPNPARTSATINCALPPGSRPVRLAVYDVAGRLVRRLDPPAGAQGYVAVEWDGRDESGRRVASGVYFACIKRDGATERRGIVLVR